MDWPYNDIVLSNVTEQDIAKLQPYEVLDQDARGRTVGGRMTVGDSLWYWIRLLNKDFKVLDNPSFDKCGWYVWPPFIKCERPKWGKGYIIQPYYPYFLPRAEWVSIGAVDDERFKPTRVAMFRWKHWPMVAGRFGREITMSGKDVVLFEFDSNKHSEADWDAIMNRAMTVNELPKE